MNLLVAILHEHTMNSLTDSCIFDTNSCAPNSNELEDSCLNDNGSDNSYLNHSCIIFENGNVVLDTKTGMYHHEKIQTDLNIISVGSKSVLRPYYSLNMSEVD